MVALLCPVKRVAIHWGRRPQPASMALRPVSVRAVPLIFLSLILLCLPAPLHAARLKISVFASQKCLASEPVRLAVDDSLQLLRSAFPGATVSLNRKDADIVLLLPEPHASVQLASPPGRGGLITERTYRWTSQPGNGRISLRLLASSPPGIADGIYGLLQEKLGFSFIHPRQTIVPVHRRWPLPARFAFSARPRFSHRGFHLHTLHPMELTEQLHNPAAPDAFRDVAAYLDWLARNGQDTFQFFLLRGIDRDAWIPHAARIVAHAHGRGIRCGVEISLSMLQQQAFQAITLLRPIPSYRRQVDATLAWLFRVPWDFITLEPMMGEHLPLLGKLLPGVQSYAEQQVTGQYGRQLMLATHVICDDGKQKVRRPLERESGILIHTVMCYSASEAKAPVYGNRNQRFMLEAAAEESRRRETWYWPESSYWVGFDTSVPLLILPYLEARWSDMETMAGIGVDGHLTFSSGWEWGYWLIDWSIARWSWEYADNGRARATSPLSRMAELFPDPVLAGLWREALSLQLHYFKERELLRYLAALTPFSELPSPFDRPFQPEPPFDYPWLLHKADKRQVEAVSAGPIRDLERYAAAMHGLSMRLDSRVRRLERTGGVETSLVSLADELNAGLKVSALRARHRALTLQALIAKREERDVARSGPGEYDRLLTLAQGVRRDALFIVRRQESRYRYPLELLARRRQSLTAYQFGYLYPTGSLYFWEREEEQVREERFDAFFMNLWDIRRTIGLESLFFH